MPCSHGLYTCGLCRHFEHSRPSSSSINTPQDVHHFSSPQPQHYQGYSRSHQSPGSLSSTASGYGYSYPETVMQRTPSAGPPQAYPGVPRATPILSGCRHGNPRGALSRNPMESYTANVHRQVPDHNVSPGFRFPQTSPPQGESVAGVSPLGRRKMKHLTCWYWHDKGDCVYPEDRCLYTHSYVGTQRIADAPVQKQPGMPAVAGRNALQAYPVYSDWTANRGLSAHDPRRSMPVTSPETLQDPTQVKTEPDLPEEEATQGTLPARQSPREADEQEREKAKKREAPDDDIFASAPLPKAFRSQSFPSAEPTPSAAAVQETEAQNILLRDTVRSFSQIVSDLLKGRVLALRRHNKACGTLLDEINALPGHFRAALLKPLSGITKGISAQAAADDGAKAALDGLREKLVEAEMGGLLTVMDREFGAGLGEEGTGAAAEESVE